MSNKKSKERSSPRDFFTSWWTERGARTFSLSGVSRYYLVSRRDAVALAPGLFNFLGEDRPHDSSEGNNPPMSRRNYTGFSSYIRPYVSVQHRVLRAGSSSRKTAARAARVTSDVHHQSQARDTFLGSRISRPLPLRALSTDCAESLGASSPDWSRVCTRCATPIGELHGKGSWISNTHGSLSRILKYRAYFSIISLQSAR